MTDTEQTTLGSFEADEPEENSIEDIINHVDSNTENIDMLASVVNKVLENVGELEDEIEAAPEREEPTVTPATEPCDNRMFR